MARIDEQDNLFFSFFRNIIWFNIKKLRISILWRIILIIINFMLLFYCLLHIDIKTTIFIFIIVSLSNILFIYTRTNAKRDSISLLKSIGASNSFIIMDNSMEVLIEFFISFILILFCLPFYRNFPYLFWVAFSEFMVIILVTPLFSLNVLTNIEKQSKEM